MEIKFKLSQWRPAIYRELLNWTKNLGLNLVVSVMYVPLTFDASRSFSVQGHLRVFREIDFQNTKTYHFPTKLLLELPAQSMYQSHKRYVYGFEI